jgi:nucleotide-binding universal stress UspA family protein
MGDKTISITVTDILCDWPALSAAAALALRDSAHLDVFCVGIDPVQYSNAAVGSIIMYDTGQHETEKQANALVEWAKSAMPLGLERASIRPVVIQQLGLDHTLSRLIRYSDLVVATKPYGEGRSAWQVAVLDAALLGTKAPVMIVPDGVFEFSKPFKRVMVAWNDSDEVWSSLQKNLTLLKRASHVDIVLVNPTVHSAERSDPGGAVSAFLGRHGVKTEVCILARSLPRVSDVLLRFAQEQAVDAIVMGAYGHSRLREAILGGVTRDLLEHGALPIIMAQ